MDRFDTMRLFVRIVERRSFTLAASDLDLPRSTVTQAIKRLETRLGVRLLQRTTRHVSPTLDGEAYHRRCVAILAEVEDAEGAFLDARPTGLLRVDMHGTLARTFVLPDLPDFLARYPGLRVHIGEGDRWVDLVREGVDCVLRVGDLADSSMVGRRIAMLEEVTCASPAYLERHGVPQTPDDLDGHLAIGFLSTATGSTLPLEFVDSGNVRLVNAAVGGDGDGIGYQYRSRAAGTGPDPGAALSPGGRSGRGSAGVGAARLPSHALTGIAAVSAQSPAVATRTRVRRLGNGDVRRACP